MCTVTRLAAAAERLAICEGNLGRAHEFGDARKAAEPDPVR